MSYPSETYLAPTRGEVLYGTQFYRTQCLLTIYHGQELKPMNAEDAGGFWQLRQLCLEMQVARILIFYLPLIINMLDAHYRQFGKV